MAFELSTRTRFKSREKMNMTAANTSSGPADPAHASNRVAYYFYVFWVLAALAASAVLISTDANAQAADGAAPAASSPASSPSQSSATPPRYSATEIERAFNFMDAHKDGKISREEAAGFRNVARHFDAADTNQDNALSLEEFGNALNRP